MFFAPVTHVTEACRFIGAERNQLKKKLNVWVFFTYFVQIINKKKLIRVLVLLAVF